MTKTWEYFLQERDMQNTGPASVDMGEFQSDPDKPDHDNGLAETLKEIIQIAQRALEMREKGLGDKSGNGKPNEDGEGGSMNKLVSRPNPDSAEGMFGQD